MADITETLRAVSGGYEINIADAGSGPNVVFIHGSGPGASGASNFRGNYEAFIEAGYRVSMPDMIGYGASSKPEGVDYPLQLFTDTLYEALVAHGVENAALVGNSLGGAVAIQMALDHPEFVTSLVLLAPGCVEEQAEYFKMPGIAKMASGFGSSGFNLAEQKRLVQNLVHPSFAEKIPDSLVEERFAVAKTQPNDVLARMKTPNLAPRLGELDQPIFVLWGRDDEFCPENGARYFIDRCKNARAITFANTGHWVQVERVQEFNQYGISFLNENR